MLRVFIPAVLLLLASCQTPPIIGSGGGAATAQEGADGTNAAITPNVATVAPGALGDAKVTELGYSRQDQGTMNAPQFVINLQPAPGAQQAASYPALTTIAPVWVVLMANAQRDGTLSSEQIDKVKEVTGAAGAVFQAINKQAEEASGGE